MINLDNYISQIIEGECLRCNCIKATFDNDPKTEVSLSGSICYPVEGHANHIQMTAFDLTTGLIVWADLCEMGVMCQIPFTIVEGSTFICY